MNLSDEEIEEMDVEVTHNEGAQLITFILGEEKYGLDILTVRELISYPEGLTQIPGMPDFIVGMFNLRGLVIPVMDLRIKFKMATEELHDYSVIIIVQVEEKNIGLIVDSVADVISSRRMIYRKLQKWRFMWIQSSSRELPKQRVRW